MTSPALVLIVEDEFLISTMAADILQDDGHRTVEAGDADEAIALMEAGLRPDLVFTDINMPGSINGLALAARLKRDYASLPVIVTSGRVMTADALDPPPDAFLAKPYTASALMLAVRTAFGE